MMDLIGDFALNAESGETQLSGCVAALNRLEGLPVVKRSENLDVPPGPTFEELVRESLAPKLTE